MVRHPKVHKLSRILGVSVPQTIGHLHCLWYWSLDFAQDGSLTGFSVEEIASAAMWEGDPSKFVDALVECGPIGKSGFLDRVNEELRLHDWWDYAGKLIEKRISDRERKRSGGRTDSAGAPLEVAGNTTQPNTTQPTKRNVLVWFEEIWKRYPARDGKKAALRHFEATVKTEQDWAAINSALDEYLKSKKVRDGFVKNGSTWFNNWRDWIVSPTKTLVVAKPKAIAVKPARYICSDCGQPHGQDDTCPIMAHAISSVATDSAKAQVAAMFSDRGSLAPEPTPFKCSKCGFIHSPRFVCDAGKSENADRRA